ncbi:hypothetical protein PoB_004977300 [Plakobranchus ocellatus]|uniref:Uncharacterized protein n=1 Tax=Plakobranchus ocellatus TaxID=259542 RepID=A0AAV4BVM1_9GAST|nr:hypothetical protein PoB_004977300 [Plakobranchus ocellatus]
MQIKYSQANKHITFFFLGEDCTVKQHFNRHNVLCTFRACEPKVKSVTEDLASTAGMLLFAPETTSTPTSGPDGCRQLDRFVPGRLDLLRFSTRI